MPPFEVMPANPKRNMAAEVSGSLPGSLQWLQAEGDITRLVPIATALKGRMDKAFRGHPQMALGAERRCAAGGSAAE